MSIADNLKLLAETKWAIKEAIESKGVAIASTDVFSSYPEKIKKITSTPSNMNDPGNTYARPTDWLPLPDVNNTEEKFVGLCAVFADKPSIISINVTNQVDIDWGDGTQSLGCYPGGAGMVHTYNYSSLPDSSLCSRGYKQAIVTITLSATASTEGFICFYLQNANNSFGSIKPVQYWLDVKLSSPGLQYMAIADNTPEKLPLLEQFSLISDNQLSGLPNTFKYLYGLKCVPLLVCNNVTGMGQTFYYCENLVYANITKTEKCNYFGETFSSCFSLKKVEGITFGGRSGIYAGSTFWGCYGLEYIPEINFGSGSYCECFLSDCLSLRALPPNVRLIGVQGNTMFSGCKSLKIVDGLTIDGGNYEYAFSECSALEDVRNFKVNTGPGVTFLSRLFSNCYSLKNAEIEITDPGDGSITLNLSKMFDNCQNLKHVSNLNTTSCDNFESMFYYCKNLETAPQMDTSNGYVFTDMFNNCTNLKTIPQYNFDKAYSFDGVFACCASIKDFGEINLPRATTITDAFTWCGISKLNLKVGTELTLASAFGGCWALEEIINPIDVTNITQSDGLNYAFENSKLIRNCPFVNIRVPLDISNCSLDRSALVALFNNLSTPFSTSYKSITITGNPGVSTLTTADKAIATDKGWTLIV